MAAAVVSKRSRSRQSSASSYESYSLPRGGSAAERPAVAGAGVAAQATEKQVPKALAARPKAKAFGGVGGPTAAKAAVRPPKRAPAQKEATFALGRTAGRPLEVKTEEPEETPVRATPAIKPQLVARKPEAESAAAKIAGAKAAEPPPLQSGSRGFGSSELALPPSSGLTSGGVVDIAAWPPMEDELISVALIFQGKRKLVRHLANTLVGDLLKMHAMKNRSFVLVDQDSFEVGKNVPLGTLSRQQAANGDGGRILELTLQEDAW